MRQYTKPITVALVVLWSSNCLGLDGRVPFKQYGYDEWQITEGLPDNNVMAIAQTPDGYLWVGTSQGLSRFNGVEFVNFTTAHNELIPGNSIYSLLPARDGVLWIGTNKGVATWTPNGFVKPPSQTHGNLFGVSLKENNAGEIWVGGDQVVTIANGVVQSMAQGLLTNGEILRDLCVRSDGSVCLAKKEALFLWRQGILSSVDAVNSQLKGTISCVYEDRNHVLWIGTSQGLLRWDGAHLTHYGTENGLTHRNIRCVYEDRDGTLWIGSSYGLNRLSHGVIASDPSVCGNEYIFTIYEDWGGNLWVGTYLGLRRLSDRPIRVMNASDGLFHSIIQAIHLDRQDAVWMASYLGGLYRYQYNEMVPISLGPDLGERSVACLEQGTDGRLWLGLDDGIGFLRDGETSLIEFPIKGVGAITDLLELDDGHLLVALSSGIQQITSERLEPYRPDLLPEERALVLHASLDGSLWVGYAEKGLYHLRSDQVETFTTENGLPHNAVYSLCDDPRGLWIGTGEGIAFVHNGRVHGVSQEQDLFREPVYNLIVDDNDDLWFCTSRHLALLKRGEITRFLDRPDSVLHARVFSKTEGLDITEWKSSHRGVAKQANGVLWFPSQEGAIVIDPNAVVMNTSPPPVYIERCNINRKPIKMEGTPRIGPLPKDLEFHYIALNLLDPENVRYRYRLEGADSDWVEAGTRRTAYYNTLLPGEYQFQVMACNRDGLWNGHEAAIAFIVLPSFYQTWWFIVLATVIGVGSIATVSRFMILRRMRHKLEWLRQQNLLNQERTRIARDIHDDLGAGVTEIALLSELGLKHTASQDDKPANCFNRILKSSRQIVESMDEIVWAINPENDTLDQFAAYLCEFTEDLFKLTPIRFRLCVPTCLPDVSLSADMRHSLFMVAKEALNNVVKHSEATEMNLSLNVEKGGIEIRIVDDGRGFDHTKKTLSRGRGLGNMEQRILALRGRFTLTSDPDRGTCVELFVPL